jgi:hypothetical protein
VVGQLDQGVLMERRVGSLPQVTAVYTQGKLLLAATGIKPFIDDQVLLEPKSLFAAAPSFSLRVRPGMRVDVERESVPYQLALLFEVGGPPDEVVVDIEGEEHRLPVLIPADGEAVSRREAVPLVGLATARQGVGRATMPAVFAELLAHVGQDVQPPLVWPIRLGPLFEGRLEPAAANPRRAIGYSDSFDFAAAFLDALRSLPTDDRAESDQLTTIHVTGAGALLPGDGGGRRLFVSILAY